MSASADSVQVLHVDDDPGVLDLSEAFLERERETFEVRTATSPSEGLEYLTKANSVTSPEVNVDCIVSDYNMPRMDGLDFLERVREEYPDLPFILFTGKGSEEIASEAITAGVSDYLNKGSGTDQYTLLANRIENLVSQYRTERELQRSTERLEKLYGGITDAIFVLNHEWEFTHLNERAEELLQRSEAELVGENVWEQFSAAVGTTFQEQYEKAMDQRVPVAFEEFYPPLDTWFQVRAVPTEDGLTAHFRDITEKKERERTIRTQNERLETIIGNAPLVLFAFDEDGTFTFSEGRGLDQLDLEAGELVGESIFDAYAETPQVVEDARQAIDGEKAHSTVRVSDRYFEIWFRPVTNGVDTVDRVIGVAIDATERIEQERELERKTDLLERAQNIADIGGWELDPSDDELQWTEQVHRIHGVSLDYEPTLEEAIDFYHPEDVPTVEDAVERAIMAGESFDEELRLIAADGTQRWVRAQGEPRVEDGETVLLRGVFQDITERKRTEDELRDEREFIDTVLDTLDDVFYVVDTDGRFVRWNDRLTDVTGYTDAEVGEMHPTEFFEEADRERIAATMSEAFETGQASITADIHTKSGENIPHEFHGTRVSDADGEVLGVCGIARDVTERIERERRYDAIFNQTFQFTGLMEPDGTLIEANETARRFGGVEPEDVIGEYIWDSYWWEISAEARERVREAVERAAEGEFVRYEEEVKSADGSAIIDFSIKPITDKQGKIVLLIPEGRDITERAERERRFDAVFNNTFQFMGLLDPDGTVVEINDTALEFSGNDRAEIVGQPFWDLPPLESSEETVERVKDAAERAANGEFDRFEEELGSGDDVRTIDTSITPVIGDGGDVEYLVAEGRDITERKESERELETTRARFRSLTENTTLGVLTMDAESTIWYANDAIEELFGYAPDELVGESMAMVIPDRLEEAHFAGIGRYLDEGERALDWEWIELPARHADGHEITIGVSFGEYVVDGERRFTSVIRDITDQKNRERALEERAAAMETSMDGMAILDAEGRYTYLNQAHAAAYGYDDPESFVGEHWEMCYADGELQFFEREVMPVLEAEGQWRGEATGKRRDGTTFPQELSLTALEGGGLVCVVRDVSERKKREAERETERERFLTLFENISDPAVIAEAHSGEPILQQVNQSFEEVFGYPAETAIGKSLDDLIVPPEQEESAKQLDESLQRNEQVELEVQRETAEGELREFLFRSVPIESESMGTAFGIYIDVTDRREHERYRRRLYEITADAELATDEIIERALDLGCEYLGLESGFLTHIEDDTQRIVRATSPHEAIKPGSECPLSEAYCRKTMEMDELLTVAHAGASGWEGDPAYERFGLEAYVGARLTIEGNRYGTVCFADRSPREREFSDLDRSFVDLLVRGIESTLERHKYETELERQNDQLGEFASVISHDLRNPLTVADGYLELASETGDDEYFTKVGNAHDRMDAIIEDVLTLTRQGERIAETTRVGLAAVAEGAWENVATGDADLVVAGDLGEVDADEGRLTQLFENLYRNAIEHGGESITVRVGRHSAGFYVEDDGSGIPESERERVFESGYTTGEEGTGMGLSIVETIATAHGWGIGVEEGSEGGARFKVQLGMTRGGSDDLLLAD